MKRKTLLPPYRQSSLYVIPVVVWWPGVYSYVYTHALPELQKDASVLVRGLYLEQVFGRKAWHQWQFFVEVLALFFDTNLGARGGSKLGFQMKSRVHSVLITPERPKLIFRHRVAA